MTETDRSTGAASRSDMPVMARRLTSAVMRAVASPGVRDALRKARELRRRWSGDPHRVHYFHQVDDPYSHLAVQALAPLQDRYEIEIVPHLVGPELGPNMPEPELLEALARRDASAVAPHYQLSFPAKALTPLPESAAMARRIVAGADASSFADTALRAGKLLWQGDRAGLEDAASSRDAANAETAHDALSRGDALRRKLGHYASATFHYAGEWYWGVDRLYHLEQRLRDLGVARPGTEMRFPRPKIDGSEVARGGEMTLEVFPSLRSPYTAIGFWPCVELARSTGVELVVRPVLPMVMRGVPVTLRKGAYIFRDAVREGETLGVPFGKMLDPIGTPVRRAYSLWPFARDAGRGAEYLAAFLWAAFAEAKVTWSDDGLREIVEGAGLSWQDAKPHLDDDAWEAELEENRLAMYGEMGLWGVPSFRLRGPSGEPELSVWGQDRLWLLGREIQRRGASR